MEKWLRKKKRLHLGKASRIKKKSLRKIFFYLIAISEEEFPPLHCWVGEVMCGAV